ncbi:SDR family oxidoreductase [Alphaproteobacteria bacterium]|nr:SDR family oxidoreductase [Alphaproteobacteria bacterium]
MKNKTVIVTGGASGIGKSICEEYANLGWEVLILDINSMAGEALKIELSKISSAVFYYCDFSTPDSIKNTAKEIRENHPSINSIIHNARAPNTANSIADNLNNEIDRDFNIFIRSPLMLCELLYTNLVKSQDAAITFIGSTNSSFISHQPLSYHVCKGALMQAVRFLAVSWGPKNIRVNLVNPGIVDVPGKSRKNINIFSKAIKAVIPLGRTALASEVATACTFLSSSHARYITGTTINLDGGEHLKDHFSLAYKIFESDER